MHFAKALLVGASLAVAVVAQTGKLAFTTLPTSVIAGSPTELKWAGGDGTAVTITLQQGSANNLQTVQIITGSATGNSYTWTPSKSLANGDNYALKITQGTSDVNYSGLFSLSGGSTSSASSSSSSSSALSSSATSVATPVVPVPLPSTANATTTSTLPSFNATTTAVVGTGVTAGAGATASGTGIPISRNATLSIATLTSTSSTSAGTTTSGTGSATSSRAPSSTTRAPNSSAAGLGSPLAFVLSAFVAVVYLG